MTDGGAEISSPYKGLAAFEDTVLDALLFFGRERDTDTIAANVMASRFTVLYGPLGVGKSSVLRAGVVRKLRAVASDAGIVINDSWADDPAARARPCGCGAARRRTPGRRAPARGRACRGDEPLPR